MVATPPASHDLTSEASRPRVLALDGLRGLAAVVVFVEHFILTIPVFSQVFMRSASDAPSLDPWTLEWWLSYTPLHVIWQGTGAVYIFFILSGYVLTLPAVRAIQQGKSVDEAATSRLGGYYVRRMFRLYIPVWAAIGLGLAAMAAVPRSLPEQTAAEPSLWLLSRTSVDPTPMTIAQDASLLFGAGEIVSPLWSLQWEVIFSLLLPLYVLLALKYRHRAGALTIISLGLVTLGALTGVTFLVYLPMFLLGVILATAQDRIKALRARLNSLSRLLILLAALVLITSRWNLLGITFIRESYAFTVTTTLVGAALIVFLTLHSPLMSRVLASRPMVLLGRFSFSLYLVHEPILVSAAFLFPNDHLSVLLVSIAAVMIVTIAFYYLIERPSQHLGRFFDRHLVKAAA